jgi:hypothetical protein
MLIFHQHLRLNRSNETHLTTCIVQFDDRIVTNNQVIH